MKAARLTQRMAPRVLEICAGGGGQASGLEAAGFEHAAAVEIDEAACATLRENRPDWEVIPRDVRTIDGKHYKGVDLLAGGVPCPPFSIAGKQLGRDDERDMFPVALDLVRDAEPRAVLLENVPGFASAKFEDYRGTILRRLASLGYIADWKILNACDYGVPQLRPRFVLVALRPEYFDAFEWPVPVATRRTVGETLADLMAERGWPGAAAWVQRANGIAPTLVGGSKKHGGADLGPTRARRRWAELGVEGISLADEAPGRDFPIDGMPRLTMRMVARVQGFRDDWSFAGRKTASYRQVGNAFPPPVAEAVGRSIFKALASGVSASPSPPATRPARRRPVQLALP